MPFKFLIKSKDEADRAKSLMQQGGLSETDLDELAQSIADFEDGIDSSPYPLKFEKYNKDVPKAVTPGAPETGIFTYNPKHKYAADYGVDVDSDTPYNVSFGAQFAANDMERRDWYEKSLSKELGYDVKVRPSPYVDGGIEYLKKGENGKFRWTLAKDGFTGAATKVALAAPEIAGTVAGAALTAPAGPIGMSLGSNTLGAAGAGIGDYVKNEIGRSMGMNTALTPEAQRKEALGAAGKSAALGFATDIGTAAFRFLRYWFKGYNPLGKWDSLTLLKNAEEGQRLVEELNKYADPDHPLNLSIPQKAVTARTSPAGLEEYSLTPTGKRALGLQHNVQQDPALGTQLNEWTESSEDSLLRIYDNMAAEVKANAPNTPSAYAAGSPALEAAREARGDIMASTQAEVAAKEAEIKEYIAEAFPDAPPQQLVMETRKALQADKDYWKENERLSWGIFGKWFKGPKDEYKPILVPVDDQFAQWLRNDQTKKYFSFFKQNPVISSTNLRGGRVGGGRVPMSAADQEFFTQFDPRVADAPQTQLVDIGGLTNSIKTLRSRLRKQVDQGQISFSEVKEIETQLRDFRARALAELGERDPQYASLAEDLRRAEFFSKKRGDMFDQGLVKRFLRMNREQWSVQDMTAIGQMLAVKDEAGFDHFVSVLNQAPEAKQKLKETFLGLYTANYTKDGLPTPQLHAKFMKDHGWAMKKLWGDEGITNISTMEGLAKDLAGSREKLKDFDTWFTKRYGPMFGGKTADNVKAEDLVTGVWSGSVKGEDLRSFLGFVQERDRVLGTNSLEYYKNGVLTHLRSQITTDGKLNSRAMESIIDNRRDALDIMFGPGFTKNFNRVYQAVKIIDTPVAKQAKTGAVESKILEYGLRTTVAPPLTREGRLLTLGSFLRSSNYRKSVTDIFVDPSALSKMAQFSDKMLTIQQWNNVMAKIVAGMTDD